MNITELKKRYNLKNRQIASVFGLSESSYLNSSAKKRYEKAFIEIYKLVRSWD